MSWQEQLISLIDFSLKKTLRNFRYNILIMNDINEDLHRVYLLCSAGHEHVRVSDAETMRFRDSFDKHLDEIVKDQPILFEDDVPHHWQRSLKHNALMLVLEVSSESIVSVNGQLFLEQKKVNANHIIVGYFADDVDQFLAHEKFEEPELSLGDAGRKN